MKRKLLACVLLLFGAAWFGFVMLAGGFSVGVRLPISSVSQELAKYALMILTCLAFFGWVLPLGLGITLLFRRKS